MEIAERPEWQVRAGRWEPTLRGMRHVPVAPTGRSVSLAKGELQLVLPGRGAQRVQVSCEVESAAPNGMALRVDDVSFHFGVRWRTAAGQLPESLRPGKVAPEQANREMFLTVGYGEQVEAYVLNRPLAPGAHRVEAEAGADAIRFRLDGETVFTHCRLRQRPFRVILFETWCISEIRDVRVELDGLVPAPPLPKPKERFVLSTSLDGTDMLQQMSYTPAIFAKIMRGLKARGFKRVYFIDYGSRVPEFWTNPAMQERHRQLHGHKPGYEHMLYKGEYLKLFADLAHEAGLEFYTKFKAFDLHLWSEDPLENFSDRSRVQYEHREKKMQRRPLPGNFAPPDAPVAAIRFVRDCDAESPVRADELRLWVSDDNRRYRPYEGAVRFSDRVEMRTFVRWWEETPEAPRAVRVLSLEGLDVRAPYWAVTLPQHRTEELFRNRLHRLVEMETADGRPFPYTYAIHPDCKPTPNMGPEDFPWHGEKLWKGGFRVGIYWGGVPSGAIPVVDPMDRLWALDNLNRAIAFAREQVEFAGSAFCPVYDAVHEFWLSRLRTAYESGADGVDLRIRNHNKYMEWARAGYNPPVVEEYRRRYGVDITREPVDHVKHQQLLGEYYTNFVRQARALSRRFGKSLQHHVSISMDVAPAQMGMMNIHWDWRRWVEEGLIDEVTLKEVFPGTAFFDEVMDLARAKGVKTHFCPFMNTVLARDPHYEKVIGDHIAAARRFGCDGYWLHELYCLLKLDVAKDEVEFTHPKLAEAFRRADV